MNNIPRFATLRLELFKGNWFITSTDPLVADQSCDDMADGLRKLQARCPENSIVTFAANGI